MEYENYYTETNKLTFFHKVIQFYYKYLGNLFPDFSTYLFAKLFSKLKKRELKERHLDFLETAEKKKLLIDNNNIQFYFWGNGEKKILIVHGWEGLAADFRAIINKLLKAGYSVVAFDLPAHGNSSGKFTHLPMIISLLKKSIHELGPFYGVVSHSLGAAASAFTCVELNGSIKVSKLVLMGLHPVPFEFFEQIRQLLKINDKLFEKCVLYVENRVGRKVSKMSIYESYNLISAKNVLLIHDKYDEVINLKIIKKLNNQWQKSELFTGQHGGHYKHFKHTDVIEKIVSFMDENN